MLFDSIEKALLKRRIRKLEERQEALIKILGVYRDTIRETVSMIKELSAAVSGSNDALIKSVDVVNNNFINLEEDMRISHGRLMEMIKRK